MSELTPEWNSGNKKVIISLAGEQPMPNIIPALHFENVRRVDLISTNDARASKAAGNTRKVLEADGIEVRIHVRDPFDLGKIQETSKRLFEENRGEGYSVIPNITGGTKLMSVGLFNAAREKDSAVIYLETRAGKLYTLSPALPKVSEEDIAAIFRKITIKRYLLAHGQAIEERKNGSIPSHPELSKSIAEFTRDHKASALMGRFRRMDSVRNTVDINDAPPDLIRELLNARIVSKRDNYTLLVQDEAALKYLKGFWLEDYVYEVVKTLPVDDCTKNLQHVWSDADRQRLEDEEDVIFTCRGRMFVVSCKTGAAKRNDEDIYKSEVYRMDSLARAIGGLYGEGMLITSGKIDATLRERAKMLRISVISGKEIWKLRSELSRLLPAAAGV
jgi:hypothetical protein